MTPLVSIVMPTRDRRQAVARAVASVEAQSFQDFELIVVDDGSVDGTVSWLRATRPRLTVVAMSRSAGAAAARNRGVAEAKGKIVAFLDDDDVWRPEYLHTQVRQLEAHPDAGLCTTGHVEIDAAGRTSEPDLRPLYQYGDPLVHHLTESPIHTLSVVTCRRAALDRVGPFDESLAIVHDLDWYLRFIASGGRMRHVVAPLVERAVPGGLVARHRQWFREEQAVHRRMFAAGLCDPADRRRVRAARALLFARVALTKGDVLFGATRLAEAFAVAPLDAASMAARRVVRSRSPRAVAAGPVEAGASR